MCNKKTRCIWCGNEGGIEFLDTKSLSVTPSSFAYLGHDPFSGDLHFRCLSCGMIFTVDPMNALDHEILAGAPLSGRDSLLFVDRQEKIVFLLIAGIAFLTTIIGYLYAF